MMDNLETEYIEGLKVIAFWHNCPIKEVIARVAADCPTADLGLAVRWFVWDFFVNHRHFDRTPEKRWHLNATHRRHRAFNAAPTPTRHFILDYRKTSR